MRYLLILLSIFLLYSNNLAALQIETINCSGDESLIISGVAVGTSCSVTDAAGGKKTATAEQSGSHYKLDLNTNRFLNNSNESFTLKCAGESISASYGSSCKTWTVDGSTTTTNNTDTTEAEEEEPIPQNTNDPYWRLDLFVPASVPVGQPINLRPEIIFVDAGGESTSKLGGVLEWHFGDGQKLTGDVENISHQYFASGTYTLFVEYFTSDLKIRHNSPSASFKKKIIVFQPNITLSMDQNGNLVFRNNSDNALHIQGWRVVSDGIDFDIRGRVVLASGEQWSLAREVSGFNKHPFFVQVFDTEDNIVASKNFYKKKVTKQNLQTSKTSISQDTAIENKEDQELDDHNESIDTTNLSQEGGDHDESDNTNWMFIATFILILTAIFLAIGFGRGTSN